MMYWRIVFFLVLFSQTAIGQSTYSVHFVNGFSGGLDKVSASGMRNFREANYAYKEEVLAVLNKEDVGVEAYQSGLGFQGLEVAWTPGFLKNELLDFGLVLSYNWLNYREEFAQEPDSMDRLGVEAHLDYSGKYTGFGFQAGVKCIRAEKVDWRLGIDGQRLLMRSESYAVLLEENVEDTRPGLELSASNNPESAWVAGCSLEAFREVSDHLLFSMGIGVRYFEFPSAGRFGKPNRIFLRLGMVFM